MRAFVLALALFVAAAAGPARAWKLEISTEPMLLDFTVPERTRVGNLRFRGGLRLNSDNTAFGGFSALEVSADGSRFLAITDTSRRYRARLVYVNGELAGVAGGDMRPLRDKKSKPLRSTRHADAESLTRARDGSLLVSFEREHRIWRYRAKDRNFKKPKQLADPPGIEGARPNGGMEAMATLQDGRFLILTEAFDIQPGLVRGWVGDGKSWQPLSYATSGGFRPTGADRMPNGDILVLERRFILPGGPAARLMRVRAADIKPGARLSGHEIATILPPLLLDNFEGVATRRGEKGETLIYLISDDNFSQIQRTLLVMFELIADGG